MLLHGIGSRGVAWDPVLADLSTTRDVLVVDLPGFGQSPRGAVHPTVDGHADHVAGLCDDLGWERPPLAGSSLGAAVALELGRRGRARSVVAFSPIGFWGASGVAWCQSVLRLMHTVGPAVRPLLPALVAAPAGRAALFSLFYGQAARVPADTLIADSDAFAAGPAFDAACDAFADHVFTGRGDLNIIPVTVAWGTRDMLLPRSQAARARRALPRAQHVTLPRCGHVPFADDPVACLMLLQHQWWASTEPRSVP